MYDLSILVKTYQFLPKPVKPKLFNILSPTEIEKFCSVSLYKNTKADVLNNLYLV